MSKERLPKLICIGGLWLLFALCATPAGAQSTYGAITGTVTDPSGGVIQNAKVEITNQSTQVVRSTVTDNEGNYRVVNLDAGTYAVVISASGFVSVTNKDLVLLARQVARLDGQLKIAAGANETVEVRDTDTILNETTTISDSRSGTEINSLALNFRATNDTSPIVVANMTPGVQPDRAGNVSVAGGLPYFTSFSIDGVSTTNVRFNGPNRDQFPSVEGIAEFKVNSANNNAEFAQVSDLTVTTRGGSSDYHGAIFWFHQNSALNARNPFATTKAKVVANTFGASLGGPVPGLHYGSSHTFFFADYDGTRRPNQRTLNELVPPDAFRNGDLSSIATPIINPATGVPFVNNQIPVNPASAAILSALYERQNQATGAAINAPNFITNVSGAYTLNSGDVRVDHYFNDYHKVFVRYSHKNLDDTGTDGSSDYDTKSGKYSLLTRLRNLAGASNWIVTPRLVVEVRGGYSVADYFRTYPLAAKGGQLISTFGLTGLPPTPKSGGLPNINFTDGTFISTSPGRPRDITNRTYQLSSSLTWLKGAHTIKGGFDFKRLKYSDILTFFNGDEFGEYYFTGAITGNSFADFLLGLPSVTTFAQNGPDTKPFANEYGWYIQDEWKVTQRITVNFGLRYELHPPFGDETNQLANFDRFFTGGRVVVQNQAGLNQVAPTFKASIGSTPIVLANQAGLPENLRKTYYGNWAPRLGISWRPFGGNKTVVRASAGIYTVPVLGSVLYSLAGVATSNAPVFQQAPTATGFLLQFPNVFPTGAGGTGGIPDFRRANQVNLKDPRNIQWGLAVEHDLGWQTLLRLSYTGSHTTSLIHSPDLNQVKANTLGYAAVQNTRPFPNFNAVLTRDNGPSAKYHAFTVELARHFARGLTFQNSYSLAKNLSNALGPAPRNLSAENGPTTLDRFNIAADYGNVAYTRRHRFLNTVLWDVPVGHGHRFLGNLNRTADLFVGGWNVTGILLLQSGPFLTPTFSGTDPSGTGVLVRGVTSTQRPDCVPGASPDATSPNVKQWFNPAAFTKPANNIGRFGSCGVGILHGPGTQVFSMTLGKQFGITERLKLRYEAAFANLFNHANYDIPNTNISSSNFGRVSGVQGGEQAGPRTIQMSLRLAF